MLILLDMGLAPTINREVARHFAMGNLQESGRLLHTLALVYWAMAASIALSMFALAPLISGHWLQTKNLPSQTIQHAVMLMGFVVACRWPVGLYQGALMGAQHHWRYCAVQQSPRSDVCGQLQRPCVFRASARHAVYKSARRTSACAYQESGRLARPLSMMGSPPLSTILNRETATRRC